jgi:hypothetical protein
MPNMNHTFLSSNLICSYPIPSCPPNPPTTRVHGRSLHLVIRALPISDLALKKQPPQIKKMLMEEFEKMGKQGAKIKEFLKQLLDEVVSNGSSLARVEESMWELKMTTDGSVKQIEAVEKKVDAPPLPPPPPLLSGTYSPLSGKEATGNRH